MSGFDEIVAWTEQEIDFESGESVQEAFTSISAIFQRDNRSSLDHILASDVPKFKQYIADRMAREQFLPETDEATDEQVGRVEQLERDIDRLSGQIQDVDIVQSGARAVKESEFVLNDTLQAIVTFFRGLFK